MDRPKIYWDSCCFVAILNNEPAANLCVSIVNEAKAGDIELIISPLTMAETVRPKGSPTPLAKQSRRKVLDFFDNEYVKLINFNREIARASLEYCWDYGLKARDAMHLAAAVHAGCDALETVDDQFISAVASAGTALRMTVRRPLGKGQANLPFGEQQ